MLLSGLDHFTDLDFVVVDAFYSKTIVYKLVTYFWLALASGCKFRGVTSQDASLDLSHTNKPSCTGFIYIHGVNTLLRHLKENLRGEHARELGPVILNKLVISVWG